MFVPETIVIVLPTIVEIPSRVVLFDEITIERSGELAVFAPVTTEDNAVYAFAALIVPSAVPLAYANDSLAWNRLFAIVIVASRASAIYFVKFQSLNAVALVSVVLSEPRTGSTTRNPVVASIRSHFLILPTNENSG